MDKNEELDHKIVYVCSKKENVDKLLKSCKKKYPHNSYRSIMDALEFRVVKPDDEKSGDERTEDEWVDWLISKCDEVWIVNDEYFYREIESANKHDVVICYKEQVF